MNQERKAELDEYDEASSVRYWLEHRENGLRMVRYAESCLRNIPGALGAVPLRTTVEVDDAETIAEESLRLTGIDGMTDGVRSLQEKFNELIGTEVLAGRIDQDTADRAMYNFNRAMQPAHTSPRFYQ